MSYFEDTTPDLVAAEDVLAQGFLNASSLERLNRKLHSALLTESKPHAQHRALLVEATRRETGVALRAHFDKDLLDVEFRSKRRLIDVDKVVSPYYGHVTDALEELYSYGLDLAVGEFWLEYFLKDNAVYRVNVVACMCAAGAVLCTGAKTRLGNPTNRALGA